MAATTSRRVGEGGDNWKLILPRVVYSSVSKTRETHGGGIWILINLLGVCCVAAVVLLPMFVRTRSCGCSNSCINNLRQLDGAIQQWALENKKGTNDNVTIADITPYGVESHYVSTKGRLHSWPNGFTDSNLFRRETPTSAVMF
jgi:hypothetical protein